MELVAPRFDQVRDLVDLLDGLHLAQAITQRDLASASFGHGSAVEVERLQALDAAVERALAAIEQRQPAGWASAA